MRSKKLYAIAAAVAMAFMTLLAPAAHADGNPPSATFFSAPIPIVGGTLSNTSSTPTLAIKDGWNLFDADGICSAYVQLYQSNTHTWTTIWSYSGSAQQLNAHYQWNHVVGQYDQLYVSATDCFGNTSGTYDYIYPYLYQEGQASYTNGWSSNNNANDSTGATFTSKVVGSKANLTFSGRFVSFISTKGSAYGTVAVYMDGKFQKNVSLHQTSTAYRVNVWNSKYLNANGSHTLTLKVVSGTVDIDAFLVSS